MPIANLVLLRSLEIILVPYYHKEVIWSIAPLIFALIMLQMYFGKYKTEPLGWNTAFGNTISLVWVTAILLRFMYETHGIVNAWNNISLKYYLVIVILLGIITITLAVFNFNHIMPKKFAFVISSSLPVNLLAYFSIVIIMGRISLDLITLYSVIGIFIVLAVIFYLYKKSITPAETVVQTLKKQEHKKNVEKGVIKRRITIFIDNLKEKIRRFGRKLMFWRKTGKKKQTAEKETKAAK